MCVRERAMCVRERAMCVREPTRPCVSRLVGDDARAVCKLEDHGAGDVGEGRVVGGLVREHGRELLAEEDLLALARVLQLPKHRLDRP
eukprot:2343481-Pleurochrysis_carterae.AAC.1